MKKKRLIIGLFITFISLFGCRSSYNVVDMNAWGKIESKKVVNDVEGAMFRYGVRINPGTFIYVFTDREFHKGDSIAVKSVIHLSTQTSYLNDDDVYVPDTK